MTTTQQAVTQYVRFRQATGTDFRSTARLLNAFCRAGAVARRQQRRLEREHMEMEVEIQAPAEAL